MSASKKLLLHVCCGPCSIMPCLRLLDEGYEITAWFMNPNIQPLGEYLLRRDAMAESAARLGIPVIYDDNSWDLNLWLKNQLPRAYDPSRCEWCCGERLRATFRKARAEGYDFFSTSLLYSRYQPHDHIKRTGYDICAGSESEFVYRDFRRDWQKGVDISREWGLYRQKYCGCVFSESERYAKKLKRLQT